MITLLSYGNATLSIALKQTDKPNPSTHLRRLKSTNIASVGSWRRAWRRSITTYWRKKTPLCVAQASNPGVASRCSGLACHKIKLLGSWKYTLSRIWNRMTITNAPSNTGVGTLSKAGDGWYGHQYMPRISFTPLSVALIAICHRNASIPKRTLQTGGGRHRWEEIPENDDFLTDSKFALRVWDTLVLLIFTSDGTHLSNFASKKTEWTAYITIGNLSSKICQMPSTNRVIRVARLPIWIDNGNIPQERLDEQLRTNQKMLTEVLCRVLQPLMFKNNPSAKCGYLNVLWTDGNFRHCKPVLSPWFADCPEYCNLHILEQHVCFWCECPKNELGDDVPPDKPHPWRDHNLYWKISYANTNAAGAKLSSC